MKKLSILFAAISLSLAAAQSVTAGSLSDESISSESLIEANADNNINTPTPTGRYFVLSHVAFQGNPDKRFGWPAYVGSFDEAVHLARQHNIVAFHYYVSGDSSATGAMYPFYSVTGYEAREGNRQTVGVVMERKTVH
ncbi:hypothetical protein H0A36_22100 [Endozoicomonas sp. SM1973]|uniref:Uncharacterized protein n=1 Tax=Spartinivicinus marinus TaxID=2994442 RepID=A0A853I5U9_9GAMM|nr:hypothetical protein [Spartinivicinus marinus]MCX4026181.1 hypothetical protein [Spartinivicinus marinus]NYZ68713.1 hypothetical protein [Spartinivicinus marinus]